LRNEYAGYRQKLFSSSLRPVDLQLAAFGQAVTPNERELGKKVS
jgi:hypothetical protein